MKKGVRLFLLLVLLQQWGLAQNGGFGTFRFLQLPVSPRLNALSGINVSSSHLDATAASQNPALLDKEHHSSLSFNHQLYFAGVQHGFFSYAHHLKKYDLNLHTGFHYLNYGNFRQFDEFELETGSFSAGDFAWIIGASKSIYERLQVGMNLKLVNSAIAEYSSFGMAVDLGARYHIDEKNLSLGFVISNAGAVFSRFTEDISQRMPYDVRLGISKKLSKAPIAFSITAHHLHRWNLMYDNPEKDNNNLFQPTEPDTRWDWLENFFRHLNFGAEIYVGKSQNFIIRAGYSHLRRRDMSVQNFRSIAGMSGGFGFRVKKFRVDYGFSTYHLAGASHHFGVSTLLTNFTKPNLLD
jgi:hypothetical protein